MNETSEKIELRLEKSEKGEGGGRASFPSLPLFSFPFSFPSFLHSCLRRKLLEDEIRKFLLPFAYSV